MLEPAFRMSLRRLPAGLSAGGRGFGDFGGNTGKTLWDLTSCKGAGTVVYFCHDKHDRKGGAFTMRSWQDIPRRGYVTRPTPLEELARFSEKAGVRVRVKRDDLLPLGGKKIRKPHYRQHQPVLPQQYDRPSGGQGGHGLPGDHGILGGYPLPLRDRRQPRHDGTLRAGGDRRCDGSALRASGGYAGGPVSERSPFRS